MVNSWKQWKNIWLIIITNEIFILIKIWIVIFGGILRYYHARKWYKCLDKEFLTNNINPIERKIVTIMKSAQNIHSSQIESNTISIKTIHRFSSRLNIKFNLANFSQGWSNIGEIFSNIINIISSNIVRLSTRDIVTYKYNMQINMAHVPPPWIFACRVISSRNVHLTD